MIGVSAKAVPAWNELADAMRTTRAACDGDARFIADHDELGHEDTTALRRVCFGCPLYDLCRTYAVTDRPAGGVWAGQRYGGRPNAAQSAAGGAPGSPGVNRSPRAVSEPLPSLSTRSQRLTAPAANARGFTRPDGHRQNGTTP